MQNFCLQEGLARLQWNIYPYLNIRMFSGISPESQRIIDHMGACQRMT